MTVTEAVRKPIRSMIPARLGRLAWSPFHTRTVAGSGAARILEDLRRVRDQRGREALEAVTKPLTSNAIDEPPPFAEPATGAV